MRFIREEGIDHITEEMENTSSASAQVANSSRKEAAQGDKVLGYFGGVEQAVSNASKSEVSWGVIEAFYYEWFCNFRSCSECSIEDISGMCSNPSSWSKSVGMKEPRTDHCSLLGWDLYRTAYPLLWSSLERSAEVAIPFPQWKCLLSGSIVSPVPFSPVVPLLSLFHQMLVPVFTALPTAVYCVCDACTRPF